MVESRIDWDFIHRLAGGQRLEGHVPSPSLSSCGVQIASGMDLGLYSDMELWELGFSPELVARLEPYCGKRSMAAVEQLRAYPLRLSPDMADFLDQAHQARLFRLLSAAYDQDSRARGSSVRFTDLSDEAQTVLASVAMLYGPSLREQTPTFWEDMTRQDWDKAVETLRDFGDAFPERHRAEADLLERIAHRPVTLKLESRVLDCPVRIEPDGRAFVQVDRFAQQLGHHSEWDYRLHQLRIDGRLVDFPLVLDDGKPWAWVSDLAPSSFFQLRVDWDGADRVIHLHPQPGLQPHA